MFQYAYNFASHYLYIVALDNHNYIHPDGENSGLY